MWSWARTGSRGDPLPTLLVDMATVAPAESAEIAAAVEPRGIGFLRAPVSGTIMVAEAGKLTVLASGERDVFDAAEPYLAALGETRYYMGLGEELAVSQADPSDDDRREHAGVGRRTRDG